jgi:hypothetical protein
LIFSQSALSGRDDRIVIWGRWAGRGDVDTPLAAVAEPPIRTAAIAVVVSIRLRSGSAVSRF